ncbi:hypothetical protein FOIG_16661 [Fusarium odoratissimum NRRL 54006]|uniref:Uncharacterized protein n=1 Tax=Fusarium odoratissimum (strain NRRL 54006) TaxID=1089451 RepID=X0IME4_FUSO5|nr:uncharacterized protein FOIG_16661 [Fusarium odoratissimum NRRL 54006]EXL90073.1 hypothetical protein FOIG_16661 [Fusarium odoratissimum NRRL 54006]
MILSILPSHNRRPMLMKKAISIYLMKRISRCPHRRPASLTMSPLFQRCPQHHARFNTKPDLTMPS